MARESYILLADYAKRAGITEDEARAYFAEEANAGFYRSVSGKELVSTAIYKRHNKAVEQANNPPQASLLEDSKQDEPQIEESRIEEAQKADNPILPKEQETEAKSKEEIERLRQEVAELKAELRNKESQIAEFAMKFADLAQTAQQIAGQAQILQAQNTPKALEATQEEAEQKPLWKRIFKR